MDDGWPCERLVIPDELKLCCNCWSWQPREEFLRDRPDGRRRSMCRTCRNEQRREYKRAQAKRERRRKYTRAVRDVKQARSLSELEKAAGALIGLFRGPAQFIEWYAKEFNEAKPGSQQRISLLVAASKIFRGASMSIAQTDFGQMSEADLEELVELAMGKPATDTDQSPDEDDKPSTGASPSI